MWILSYHFKAMLLTTNYVSRVQCTHSGHSNTIPVHAWKHRFTSECMNLLHDQAFNAKMPSYATVVQLDRKMRAFPVPSLLQVNCYGSSPSSTGDSTMLTLQRHIVLAIREAGK